MYSPRLLILYGSQTGSSRDVAENISLQSRGSHIKTTVCALDSYPVKSLTGERFAIFVCSTTGQGEPPDNMKKFWRFIMRKNLPMDSLCNLEFGVLGLGDSSYAKYNFVAKKLERRLIQLGGRNIINVGLADDQHLWGADAAIDKWVTEMWMTLLKTFPTPPWAYNPLDSSALPLPRFKTCLPSKSYVGDAAKSGVFCRKNPYLASVKTNTRLTSEAHFQKTVLLVLDIEHAGVNLSYKPGDVVMILPSNIEANVNAFLEFFSHFSPDEEISLCATETSDSLPYIMQKPTTLRKLATQYMDFMSTPRRSFFQMLRHFAVDELEREKLIEFSIPEGTDERRSYVDMPRRTILEILQDFHKTAKSIPLLRLIEMIPAIQPRPFSIASSPSKHKDEIHVLVAVVKFRTILQTPRQGLCSTWISSLRQNAKVPLWIKKGGLSFSNTKKHKTIEASDPCIMIGPGTGVAPFRSAIHERVCCSEKANVLFFGCRSRDGDFYFENEWKNMVNNGELTLHVAFSRDQEEKIYVQHIIERESESLWRLINSLDAIIYVAGNSKNMPIAVRDVFLGIFQRLGGMTDKEAFSYYETLLRERRYQQETWS